MLDRKRCSLRPLADLGLGFALLKYQPLRGMFDRKRCSLRPLADLGLGFALLKYQPLADPDGPF
jgi:hypothetical protein